MAEITVADIDQAEAALLDEKGKYHGSGKSAEHKPAFDAAKKHLVTLRQQYRIQEEAAGRRTGKVGGDAVKVEE